MVGLGIWGRFVDAAGVKVTVPAPPTDKGSEWLWVYIRSQARAIGASFDFVQAPPASLAQGGVGAGCDGYGVAQRWNLGWNQPTRYGWLEDLLAMIAALNAAGARTFFDLVLHQILGPENEGPGCSTYVGADGKTRNGRGATTAGWFRGNTQPIVDENGEPTGRFLDAVPPFCLEDAVPSRAADIPFGREVSYQHCDPAGVTFADALDFVLWLMQRAGVRDFRIDDVKGTYAAAIAGVAAAILAMHGTAYAEYFDNTQNALAWTNYSPMLEDVAIEDFDWHFRLQAACNGYDATLLFAGGQCAWQVQPGLAMLFVDNPDTDTSPGMQVIANKGIAYAVTLSLPARNAVVYGKDYFPASVWPGAYGMRALIDKAAWVSRMFAFGAYATRWLDQDVFAFTRDGNGGPIGWSGGLLIVVNFNVDTARELTLATMWPEGTWVHDYFGNHADCRVIQNGYLNCTAPRNASSAGANSLAFAPVGVNKPVASAARETVQTFVGNQTLDVLPVTNGMSTLPQRIACEGGTRIEAALTLDRRDVSDAATVQVEIVGPDGALLGWATTGAMTTATAVARARLQGWHTVRMIGNLLPVAGAKFELQVRYTGFAG